jgi:hypothetical protein
MDVTGMTAYKIGRGHLTSERAPETFIQHLTTFSVLPPKDVFQEREIPEFLKLPLEVQSI